MEWASRPTLGIQLLSSNLQLPVRWIGYLEELPGALAQERTLDEARASLRQAVKDIIRTNRETSASGGGG